MPSSQQGLHVGRKILSALVLAALLGFAWAWIETERPLSDFKRLIPTSAPEPAPAPPRAPAPTPKAPAPESVAKQPATPTPPPPPPPPAPVPAAPSVMPAVILSRAEGLIREGRFASARDALAAITPPSEASRELKERAGKYAALLEETSKGEIIEPPLLTQIFMKNAGKLVVKVIREDAGAYYTETLTGIRSKVSKSDVESARALDATYSAVEVRMELKKQCGYRGIEITEEPGRPPSYRDASGKKASGIQFFDLADFCARNGANARLAGLFEEALRRDPNLVTTVHEARAARLVHVLLYFLSLRSTDDARATLRLLEARYTDTAAYREDVAGDADVRAALAPAAAPPPPPSTPPPAPPVAAVPVPAAEPAPAAPPAAVGPPPPAALPESAPPKVRSLVATGDRHFAAATRHLEDSDPNLNPSGWADQNRKALELFLKANAEGYLPAQDQYADSAKIPSLLLDKVRETTLRISLCRKRSVRK